MYYQITIHSQNNSHYYSWSLGAPKFDIPRLTEYQSLLLALTKEHLSALLPSNVQNSMEAFFESAQKQLQEKEHGKNKLGNEWLGKVCVAPTSQPLLPPQIDDEIFSVVSSALYHNKYLEIEYRNQEGKSHTAEVMPLGLAQQGTNIYLVVRYQWAKDERNLALHRIQKAKISIRSFERPLDFKLDEYKTKGHFGFGNGTQIQLEFSIDKRTGFHITETPLSLDQKIIEESDEHYRFQATVFESDMLNWWLTAFGDNVWDIEKIQINHSFHV